MQLKWPNDLPRDRVDELVVGVSDVEIGAGGPTDDFPDSAFLGDLLLRYCEPPFAELPVTVVFNGDTFDLLKTPLADGSFPLHVTESVALEKLDRVLAAHQPLFDRLRAFLAHEGAPRSLVFIVGNHDMELFFEGVQARIRDRLGNHERVLFPGIRFQHGRLHVEHGQQHDPLFAIEADRPFLEYGGERILNLPWGTVALLEVAMPFLPELYQIDRLKPKRDVLDALPEVRELLLGAFWRYWTRDFWQIYWKSRDPLRRVSWTMLQEVGYRFSTGDPEVSMQDCRRLLHQRSDDTTVILLGHEHEPALWSEASRRVLRTGCFRNEFEVDVLHGEHRQLPKVYAEVYLHAEVPVRSRLVEVDGPPAPPDAVPGNLAEILTRIPQLRAEAGGGDTAAQSAARHAQQKAEAQHRAADRLPGFVETLRSVLARGG